MGFNVLEIRKKILNGEEVFGSFSDIIICEGEIQDSAKGALKFQVTHGFNPNKAFLCEFDWTDFNNNLLNFIAQQNYSDDERNEVLDSLSLEDSHWNWFMKSAIYRSQGYEWFFLTIEGEVQGICIIKHPCGSKLNGNKIFYIEYIATAPWNRNNPYQPKRYSRIGPILISCILGFAMDQLNLNCGCCLHSLPKAEGFYDKLGMEKLDQYAKGKMPFFEFPEDEALKLIGRL